MKHLNFLSNFRWLTTVILLITLGIGQMWGASLTFDFEADGSHRSSGSNSYGTNTYVQNTCTISCSYFDVANTGSPLTGSYHAIGRVAKNTTNSPVLTIGPINLNGAIITGITYNVKGVAAMTMAPTYSTNNSTWTAIETSFSMPTTKTAKGKSNLSITGSSTFYIKFTTTVASSTSGNRDLNIDDIVITYRAKVTFNANGGSCGTTSLTQSTATSTITLPTPTRDGYNCTGWYTASSGGTKRGNAGGTYTPSSSETLYAQWEAAASCSTNPTVGGASLNGSISLSSIPLSISSVGGGTDCTLAEYGFVWKAGSTPSASDNKTKIGESSSATSFTGNITGSFSTGVTYYIKGYAINNGPNTTLSSTALPITPRSITFNSNGGSSVSTIYVNSGTAASAPTAPTKTGYNFGGWYTDNGTFASAVNWSSTISENKTYFAKWTAKTYSITLDREGASTGATGVTMTYNSSSFTGWSAPSKTGYTFGGYWTGDNGTGSMVIDASGNLQANVTNYTGAGGIWTKDATTTLYAKWTIKNYTVTWKVNGEDYTAGTPTDNVNHGSHVTTLPTAPSTASYCGDKFMGWTDATDGEYVHGTSNLYTKASEFPNATGNQVFYAVFADYVAP